MTVQSQLAHTVPRAAITSGELLAMKAKAWCNLGILLVSPDQLSNPIDQQMVKSLGERLYGKGANG